MTHLMESVIEMPPALIVLLLQRQRQKGGRLTEAEVLQVRNEALCAMLTTSARHALDCRRGYRDLDPQDVWHEWQALNGHAP